MKRTSAIILLIILHQFMIVSGFSHVVCLDHEPCHSAHDGDDIHVALFDPASPDLLIGHHLEMNSVNHPGHCACKCPGAQDNHGDGGRHALVSSTTWVYPLVKFYVIWQTFKVSNPSDFKFQASDSRIRGEVSPASLDALQSVFLLI